MDKRVRVNLIRAGEPIPYASSWLIFLHILKWNAIPDFQRLLELIDPNDVVPWDRAGNIWWCGKQIPHWRLESALRLKLGSLKYSFVDGWFPPPKSSECVPDHYRPRIEIRHCSECIKHGYHSVVFYFSHITHCPWHDIELMVCQNCTNVLTRKFGVTKGVYKAADECEHLSVVLDVIAPVVASTEFRDAVKAWCDHYKVWVAGSIELIGHNAYTILVEKRNLHDRQIFQPSIEFLNEQLSTSGSSCLNNKVRLVALKLPASKMAWEIPYFGKLGSTQRRPIRRTQPQISFAESLALFKSVRRYIFKTYLRRHRKCLARLCSLPRDGWCKLNSKGVCPCVLAYLIVFSSLAEATPHEFLNSGVDFRSFIPHRKKWTSRPVLLRCEVEFHAVIILEKFYEVWNLLRRLDQVDCKFIVFSNRYELELSPIRMPGFIGYIHLPGYGCYWDSYIFMDDPTDVLRASVADCKARRSITLCLDVDEATVSGFSNNENIQCVVHNLFSGSVILGRY